MAALLAVWAISEQACSEQLLYEVQVNRLAVGTALIYRTTEGDLFARKVDIEEWGLVIPQLAPTRFLNQDFYPLNAFEGYRANLDEAKSKLDIEFSISAFKTHQFGTQKVFRLPKEPDIGGFLNYEIFGQREQSTRLDGQFEAVLFNAVGTGTTNFLVRNMYSDGSGRDIAPRLVRLDTAWVRDFPGEIKTLKLGDADGRSGIWGRPVKFAGIQWGSNFATQPGFVATPLPSLTGESSLPSIFELYVNGIKQLSRQLPPGPFQLNNIPVFTGSGDVQLVVKDMLGREQVITQPYFTSPQLIKPGVDDYTLELGFIRENYGTNSNDYGRAMAVATQKKGFTDHLTGEWRAELLRDQQTIGVGGAYSPPSWPFICSAAVAASHSQAGSGQLMNVGIQGQFKQGAGFSSRWQWNDDKFVQLGRTKLGSASQFDVRVSYPIKGGSVGAGYAVQRNAGQEAIKNVSLNYTWYVNRTIFLNVSSFNSLNGDKDHFIGLTLNIFLDPRTFSNGYLNLPKQGKPTETIQYQRALPAGSGTGYRLLYGNGQQGQRLEGSYMLQNGIGTYQFEASQIAGQTSYQANASGSIAYLDHGLHLSRKITDGFALVKVPGFSDVPIYLNNQLVGSTDKDGKAAVPGLQAYQINKVRIDTKDMPINTQLGETEAEAIPYTRNGMVLPFKARISIGAIVKLELEDKEPAPIGTLIEFNGQEFFVAYRGEAYVTDLSQRNTMKATWKDQSCEFEVDLPSDPGPMARIGPILCKGVKR